MNQVKMEKKSKTKNNNIIEGSIWKSMLAYFAALLLGAFFQQFYNMVDTVIPDLTSVHMSVEANTRWLKLIAFCSPISDGNLLKSRNVTSMPILLLPVGFLCIGRC